MRDLLALENPENPRGVARWLGLPFGLAEPENGVAGAMRGEVLPLARVGCGASATRSKIFVHL